MSWKKAAKIIKGINMEQLEKNIRTICKTDFRFCFRQWYSVAADDDDGDRDDDNNVVVAELLWGQTQ